MTKRMLADVLWEAANKHLWDGGKRRFGEEESCFAAKAAALPPGTWECGTDVPPIPFLIELGCDYGGAPFEGFECGRVRQGVRYMWLLLAMHVAEDEEIAL
jgi:hypothetical protein